MKKLIVYFMLGVMMSACDRSVEPIIALGTLERDRIELTAESNEPVIVITAQEGDKVSKTDVIIIQDSSRIDVRIKTNEAQRRLAKARLEELINGPRPQEIDRVRAQLAATQSRINTTTLELRREQELVAKNYGTENRIDILKGRLNEAIANRTEAEAMLDELEEGTRLEQINQARHNIEILEANLASLLIDKSRLITSSPVEGIIDALPIELGERPNPNNTVAIVLQDAPVYAKVYIPGTIRNQLAVGDTAIVSIDGVSESVSAHIRWIALDAVFTPYFAFNQTDRSRLSYIAEVVVDSVDGNSLPVGVPVEVSFPGLVHD
jgi:HlyD family secretion protein